MSKSRRRYGWSLALKRSDPQVQRLTRTARRGLEYAQTLAGAARARREAMLAGEQLLPEPLSVARLAADEETSAVAINSAVKHARVELFGRDLSDSAIYYRLRTRRDPKACLCAEPGCNEQLPTGTRRRYCAVHGSGAARVRRHRRNARHPSPARRPRG
jgi:hypothetical protein